MNQHIARRLLIALSLGGAILSATSGVVRAQELFTHSRTKDEPMRWDDVVNKQVVVEGIAWGAFEKGWGEYVILNDARVYVEGSRFQAENMNGKLVRVSGTLTREWLPAVNGRVAGSTNDITLFRIRPSTITILDRVEWPWMDLVK